MFDLDRLRHWTERLQRMPDGPLAATAADLGLTGALVPHGQDIVEVNPPPDGLDEVILVHDAKGLVRVEIELSEGLSRAALDEALGVGANGPRVGSNSPIQRRYPCARPDRPNLCVVYAEFDDEPSPGSLSLAVMLLRERH